MPFIPLHERETLLRKKQLMRRPKIGFLQYPKATQGIVVFVIFSFTAVLVATAEASSGASMGVAALFAGFALMGLLVPWLLYSSSGVATQRQFVMQEVHLERGQRVAMALQSARAGRASLRELRTHLQWTEEATVDGLRAAMNRGLIFEDYDAETMQYAYVSAAAYLATNDDHAGFDARLEAARRQTSDAAYVPDSAPETSPRDLVDSQDSASDDDVPTARSVPERHPF